MNSERLTLQDVLQTLWLGIADSKFAEYFQLKGAYALTVNLSTLKLPYRLTSDLGFNVDVLNTFEEFDYVGFEEVVRISLKSIDCSCDVEWLKPNVGGKKKSLSCKLVVFDKLGNTVGGKFSIDMNLGGYKDDYGNLYLVTPIDISFITKLQLSNEVRLRRYKDKVDVVMLLFGYYLESLVKRDILAMMKFLNLEFKTKHLDWYDLEFEQQVYYSIRNFKPVDVLQPVGFVDYKVAFGIVRDLIVGLQDDNISKDASFYRGRWLL